MITRERLHLFAHGYDAPLQSEIERMARALLALDWTPITPENLPKVGDEVLAVFPRGDQKVWNVCADWMAEMAGSSTAVVRQYRRPVNPPAGGKP